jgi:di/tricarboxylate transporter
LKTNGPTLSPVAVLCLAWVPLVNKMMSNQNNNNNNKDELKIRTVTIGKRLRLPAAAIGDLVVLLHGRVQLGLAYYIGNFVLALAVVFVHPGVLATI